ncbi:MAG TPA: methyltransferase domain-containing protein [Pyrinomonadaceae bacterium]|nr:methyltransferase domain-containing protein [Pyrinomonadaceae bacterium]
MSGILESARSVLAIPTLYRLWNFIARGDAEAKFVEEYVRPTAGDRVLDIGCGPGDIVPYLPDVHYVGFDESESYIRRAQARYSDRATFICERVRSHTLKEQASFDIVLAVGVLHHLDDNEALKLFELAWAALKPGGRLVTYDGCFVPDQSYLARFFISRDRGQHVRTREEYLNLASSVFAQVDVSIRHDIMRIPYTIIILRSQR